MSAATPLPEPTGSEPGSQGVGAPGVGGGGDGPTHSSLSILTVLVVAVLLAPVLIALVHGVRGNPSDGTSQAVPAASAASGPTTPSADAGPSASAFPSSSPSPSRSAKARSVTCWDGSAAARPRACTEPTGAAGLAWVFPTIADQRCGKATATGPAGIVLRQVCRARLPGGGRAQIVYTQWASSHDAVRFLRSRGLVAAGGRGSVGVRRFTGPVGRAGQVGAAYATAPFGYIVTLPPSAASTALGQVVEARPASQVRGAPTSTPSG